MNILAGDIGGTSTRLMLAQLNKQGRRILCEGRYPSNEYRDLSEIITLFLAENKISAELNAACFAVAGPVKKGLASVTNLPWEISEAQLSAEFTIPKVKLINDFIAVAYGISELAESDFLVLQKGRQSDKGDAAVVGAGTGLGAAHLVWQHDHYRAFSSEAGHAGFTPENKLQCELLSWMQERYAHVSLELLLSGQGLHRIYRFLHEVKHIAESAAVFEEMKTNAAPAVISRYALSEGDELCQQTLTCFIEIYGAAAGNIALHYYPLDNVYIGGGIAPKIKNKILESHFINAFTNKAAMTSNMQDITVKLICQEKAGLYGALSQACRLIS
ncbi:Glucokinase [hydrothermal vent metagenome]|uniref:Glucokinase n=1 Tax=hydrothermal vent metagenome TaxID=652676 RepID=A0A3B0XHE1_9ZZZZ